MPSHPKPNPDLIARMQAAMRQRPPKPTPAPTAPTQTPVEILSSVEEHPLAHRWAVKSIRLSPDKRKYFVTLPTPYFAIIRQCGASLATVAHFADFYTVPPGATHLSHILDNKPFATIFTPPFVFHSSEAALQSIELTVLDIAETNPTHHDRNSNNNHSYYQASPHTHSCSRTI